MPTLRVYISAKLPLIIFEEDGATICFCPSLDLSGYGHTEKEAIDSYHYVVSEYLALTTEKHSLEKDLKKLGWQIRADRGTSAPPPLTKLLESNSNFKRVFEKFDYKKLSTNVRFPSPEC